MDGKDKKCKVYSLKSEGVHFALDFSLLYSHCSVTMYSFTG